MTVVRTAQALQEAVVAGMAHIEIQAHLNLAVLVLAEEETIPRILGTIPRSVKSIRVRCSFTHAWFDGEPVDLCLLLYLSHCRTRSKRILNSMTESTLRTAKSLRESHQHLSIKPTTKHVGPQIFSAPKVEFL